MNFSYSLFLIDLIQKANTKGFKFKVTENKLTVCYPLYDDTQLVVISNAEEFKDLCHDILMWK